MRTSIAKMLIIMGVFIGIMLIVGGPAQALTPEEMVEKIQWLTKGRAGVKIEALGKIIYIDPTRIRQATNDADIILITHPHNDHYDLGSLKRLAQEHTVFIAPQSCATQIEQNLKTSVVVLKPGISTDVAGIHIEAVPAYNIAEGLMGLGHSKDNLWVGYILTIEGVRVYHAGDTYRIPEMQDISCDIAMFPLVISTTVALMDSAQAAEAARDVKAKFVIPIHYFEAAVPGGVNDLAILLDGQVQVVLKQPLF